MDPYQRPEREPWHSQRNGHDRAMQRLTEQDTATSDRGDDRGRIVTWGDKLDAGCAGRLVPGAAAEALEMRHVPDRAATRVAIPTAVQQQHRGVAKTGTNRQVCGPRTEWMIQLASSAGSLSSAP
jgi:hypothetical protein